MEEDQIAVDHSPKAESTFRKVTVTIPQDLYERLIRESARRRIARAPNQMLSALFREALAKYVETLP